MCLPLADRVLLVTVYYRTNPTMRQLAPLFRISPATVCRVIQRQRPLRQHLAIEPATRPPAGAPAPRAAPPPPARAPAPSPRPRPAARGRGPAVVDRGRHPHPGPRPEGGAFSRNYRFSVNVQDIIHADTRLILDPGECVSLLPWWLRRAESGGSTLVPGRSVRLTSSRSMSGTSPSSRSPHRPALSTSLAA